MFEPKFQITNNLLTYISRIESAKTLIDNAALVPAWEAKFRDDAMARTIHYGTKIEGNDLTQHQAAQVFRLSGVASPKDVVSQTGMVARDRDIQEVINYRNVIGWIDQFEKYIPKNAGFSDEILKTLHTLTMKGLLDDDQVGEYRQKQVVVKSAADGSVVFRPPVAIEIPFLVKDYFDWINSSQTKSQFHAIFQAAVTHYQLVYIHPFIEGNGRTARAMATLMLYAGGYDFKRFFSLEQYFDHDVNAYYQALLSVQHSPNKDMTYWLEYFCYGLALEIEKVKSQVAKLSQDLKLKKELGQQVALSERQIIILELLQNQTEITSKEALDVLPNISVDTILRDMKDLIEKGVVVKSGVTKGVRYRLNG